MRMLLIFVCVNVCVSVCVRACVCVCACVCVNIYVLDSSNRGVAPLGVCLLETPSSSGIQPSADCTDVGYPFAPPPKFHV